MEGFLGKPFCAGLVGCLILLFDGISDQIQRRTELTERLMRKKKN